MNNSIAKKTNFVEILNPENNKTLKFHNIWLRDHCRCSFCYDHETFQRRLNVLDLPHDIQWKSKIFEDGQLKIECKYLINIFLS